MSEVVDIVRGPGAVLAAWILALILTWAAVAKLRSQDDTADDFASMGLAWPRGLAVVVPLVELATAALLIVIPSWGGVVAVALLLAFTVVIVRLIRDPEAWSHDLATPTCACFGGARHVPLSSRHVARNLALVALGLVAILFNGSLGTVL